MLQWLRHIRNIVEEREEKPPVGYSFASIRFDRIIEEKLQLIQWSREAWNEERVTTPYTEVHKHV
jgi:hypothetical protein